MTLKVGDRVRYTGDNEDYECASGSVRTISTEDVSVQWDGEDVWRWHLPENLEKVSGIRVEAAPRPATLWPLDMQDEGAKAHLARQADKAAAVAEYREDHLPFDEPNGWRYVEAGYVTKDSGQRQEFPTGSRRDTREGKGRYDLVSVPAIRRLAGLLERGAEKYGDRNWEKGQPLSRYLDSALRHTFQVLDGKTDEDHAAAAMWNLMAFIHTEEKIAAGDLPAELSDLA